MLNHTPYVPCMPAWSTCPTCQHPKHMPTSHIVPINVSMCQRCAKYSTWYVSVAKACQSFNFICQKAYQFFNYFSKEFFNFWIFQSCSPFANVKNIWAILENLSHQTKNLNFVICKISLRKNLINLKPLMLFSIEHMGLTKQLFG